MMLHTSPRRRKNICREKRRKHLRRKKAQYYLGRRGEIRNGAFYIASIRLPCFYCIPIKIVIVVPLKKALLKVNHWSHGLGRYLDVNCKGPSRNNFTLYWRHNFTSLKIPTLKEQPIYSDVRILGYFRGL